MDICAIDSTSLYGRVMVQKSTYGSLKLGCNICKRSCNVTSRTICWNNLPIHGTVGIVQELNKIPKKVMYILCTIMAGMLAEKL